jgi:hypothetical protein
MTDRLERLRWYNIIGPWPVRLGPVFFLTWLFGIAVTSGSRFSVLPEMSPSDALEILLPNALTSAPRVARLSRSFASLRGLHLRTHCRPSPSPWSSARFG